MKDTFSLIANMITLLVFLGTVLFTVANALWKMHCREKYNINKKYFSIPDKEMFLFVVMLLAVMIVGVLFTIYLNYSDVIYNIDISDKNTSNSNVYDIIIEKNGYRDKLTFDEDALELIDSKNFIKYRYEKLDSGKYRFISIDNIKKNCDLIKDDNMDKEPDEGYIFITFDFNGGQQFGSTNELIKKQIPIHKKLSDAVATFETDSLKKHKQKFAYWSESKDKNSEYIDKLVDGSTDELVLYAKYGEKIKVPDNNKTSLENGYKFVTFNFNDKNLKPVKLEVLEGVKIADAIEFLNESNLAVDKDKDKPFNHMIEWSLSQDKLVSYEGKEINDSSPENTDLYEQGFVEDYFNVYKLNDNKLIVVNNTKLNIFSRLVILLFILLINFGANLKKIKKSYILCRNNYIIYIIIDLIIIRVSTYLFEKIIYYTYFEWIILGLLLFGLFMLFINSNNKIILYTSMLVLSICNTMIINITLDFFTTELFYASFYYIILKNWIYTSVIMYCLFLIIYSYVSIIKTELKENTEDIQIILYEKEFKLGRYPRTLFAICEYQKKFLTVRYEITQENVLVLFTDEYWLVEPDDYYIEENHYDKIKIENCNIKKSKLCKTIEEETLIILDSEQRGNIVPFNKTKENFEKGNYRAATLQILPKDSGRVEICGKLYKSDAKFYINKDITIDSSILAKELNMKGYPKKNYFFLGFDTVMQAGVENILIVAKFIRNGSIICDETEIPEDFVKVKVIENGNLYSYAVKKGTKTYKLSELIAVRDKDKLKKELEQDNWFGSFKNYLSSAYLHIKRYMPYNKKNKNATNKEKASNYNAIDKDTNTDPTEKDQSQNNASDGDTK